MKKYLYAFIFLCFSFYCHSQTYCPAIQFLYDASGNRYYRDFNPTNPCGPPPGNEDGVTSPKKKDYTTFINVYPNPATQAITINITSKDSTCLEPTLVYMYDVNAQPVFSGSTSEQNIKLDVSSLSQGTYIVKVIACNSQNSTILVKVNNISSTPARPVKHLVEMVKY